MADMTLRALLFGEDRSMSKAFDKAGKNAEKGAKTIKGHMGGLTSALNGDFSGLSSTLLGGISKIGPWGAAAAAGIGVVTAAIVPLATSSIDAFKDVAGETLRLQRIMGGSAEDVSRLRFAFHETGVDGDAAAKAIGILSKNLVAMAPKTKQIKEHVQVATGEWRKHTEIVKDASGHYHKLESMVPVTKMEAITKTVQVANPVLAKLGLNVRDASGHIKPMADLLPLIADKFAKMPNGAEKSALALKLFGKGGLQMLPFLNRGAKGIEELKKKSDEFGLTLSGKDLDALKKSRLAHKDWDAAIEGAKVRIGAQLLPMVTKLVQYFTTKLIPIIVQAGAWVQKHGDTIQRVAGIIGKGLAGLATAWWTWEKVVFTVVGIVVKIFQGLWSVLKTVFYLILQGAALIEIGLGKMLSALSHVPGFGWAKSAADSMYAAAKQARGIADALVAIPKNVPVNVNIKVNGAGKVTLAKGVTVAVGQYRARASGGPVQAGMPYIVGEHEPELFVPRSSGTIYNGRQMAGMGGVARVEVVVKNEDGRVLQRRLLDLKRMSGRNLGLA